MIYGHFQYTENDNHIISAAGISYFVGNMGIASV